MDWGMDYKALKEVSLKTFIGFLAVTALIAIASVLIGAFGDLELKILSTTFTISAASICAMCCAAFIEKRHATVLGLLGILLSVLAALMIITAMWAEINDTEYWRMAITMLVAAIAFAHAFLLTLPSLNTVYSWVQSAAVIFISILAVLILFAVWGDVESEGFYRLIAIAAIMVGLVTLVIPILRKMSSTTVVGRHQLILEQLHDDVYQDVNGRLFSVEKIDR